MTPSTVRGASTGAPLRSRPRTTTARTLRAVVPARHALLTAAVLALVAPVPLGEAAASNDAAHYIGQTSDAHSIGQISMPKPVSTSDVRAYVADRASRSGWKGAQWRCLAAIIDAESRWNPTADNPTSSAYGVFQQLRLTPGTSLADQTRLGLKYVAHRYGTPCAALHFRAANGYY